MCMGEVIETHQSFLACKYAWHGLCGKDWLAACLQVTLNSAGYNENPAGGGVGSTGGDDTITPSDSITDIVQSSPYDRHAGEHMSPIPHSLHVNSCLRLASVHFRTRSVSWHPIRRPTTPKT